MRVLVTGGAGFIGSHLVDFLVQEGYYVRVLDNLSTGKKENLAHYLNKIEFIEGDIRDFKTCLKATEGMDGVFHLAALGSVPRSIESPEISISVNISGTVNIFSSARVAGIKKVIYASSSSVYGDSEELPKREGREGKVLSPYAYSKKSNEEVAELFHKIYGIDFIGLRYFNVYGPRQDPEGPYAAAVPRFFKAYLNNKPPEIYGDGKQTRDFTYVEDAVKATYLAFIADGDALNKVYNVSGGRQTKILDLALEIGKICNSNLKPLFKAPRKGDVLHSLADLNLSKKYLNYKPSVFLEEGLQKSKDYYQKIFQKT
ncbi:MAG: NAD-dependent epimerase/dehydratase family protein [Thermoanaerobaculia bacterium]